MPPASDPSAAPRRRQLQTTRHVERREAATAAPSQRSFTLYRWLGFIWIFAAVPVMQLLSPGYNDFVQFYYAGLVAQHGQWDALYPLPRPGSNANPGMAQDAIPKPQQLEFLDRTAGTTKVRMWFIQPPPAALLLWPLGLFRAVPAHWLWLAVLMTSMWFVARQAETILKMCLESHPSAWTQLLAPLIVVTPLAYHAVRVSNVSPMMGALIGWGAIAMFRDRADSGVPLALGALTKYATLPLGVVALLGGRWRSLIASLTLTALLVGGTLLITGPDVFREFLAVIAPTLARPAPDPDNRSLEAFLLRVTTMSEAWTIAFRIVQVGCAVLLGWLTFNARRAMAVAPPYFFAACAVWTAWMLLFSPICWDHYLVYVAPFFGWMVWEAMQSRARLVLVLVTIACAALVTPHTIFRMPEPLNSHQMIALILLLVIGAWRLRVSGGAITS